MNNKEILNLADKIEGEVNRMCVTNDLHEMYSMSLFARKNIEKLQELNYRRLTENE